MNELQFKNKKNLTIPGWWPLAIIIAAWLLLIPPLLHPYFFHTHDGENFFERVVELNDTFDHSPFGTRMLPHFADGYGLPVFYFYSPLFFYGCALLKFILSDAQSFKAMCAIILLLSGFSMYALARDRLPQAAACVSAVAYMAAPFHLVDLYTRGAVGEFTSYVFVPLFILYALRCIRTGSKIDACLLALSFTGLLLSYHLITFLTGIFSPLLILTMNRFSTQWTRVIKVFGFGILLGLGLSAFHWLPMVVEGRNLQINRVLDGFANYQNHFLFPHELFERDWGEMVYSAPDNPFRGMMFQIGLPFLFVFAGVGIIINYVPNYIDRRLGLFFLCLAATSIFFMFPISSFFWDVLQLKIVMLPWRFLFFTSIAGAYLSGWLIWQLTRLRIIELGTMTVLGVILFTWYGTTCFSPAYDATLLRKTPGEIYASGTRTGGAPATEFVLNTIQQFPEAANPEKFHILNGKGSVDSVQIWPEHYRAQLTIDEYAQIAVDSFWFPGWKLFVNDTPQDFEINQPFGTMSFALQPGEHHIELILQETWIRLLGLFISFLSIVTILWLTRMCLIQPSGIIFLKITLICCVVLFVFRAPWSSYLPMISWESPRIEPESIDYLGEYAQVELFGGDVWDERMLAGKNWVSPDQVFDFTLPEGRVLSARIFTYLLVTEPGIYEFRIQSDDSAWCLINSQQIIAINQVGQGEGTGQIYLNSGSHPFKIYYHNVGENGTFELQWKPHDQADWSSIPNERCSIFTGEHNDHTFNNDLWDNVLNHAVTESPR